MESSGSLRKRASREARSSPSSTGSVARRSAAPRGGTAVAAGLASGVGIGRGHVGGRDARAGDIVALDVVAAGLHAEPELPLRLHALGYDRDPHEVGQAGDALEEGGLARVVRGPGDEEAVYLDDVGLGPVEELEAGVAGAEVVEGDAAALASVGRDHPVEARALVGLVELRELDDDARGGEGGLGGQSPGVARGVVGHLEEAVVHVVEELRPLEAAAGELAECLLAEGQVEGVEYPLLVGPVEDLRYAREATSLPAAEEGLEAVGRAVGEGGYRLEGVVEGGEDLEPGPG